MIPGTTVEGPGWRGRAPAALAVGLAATLLVGGGCALDPEREPGCRHDAECGDGLTCQAGACFQATTDRSAPSADAGADVTDDAG